MLRGPGRFLSLLVLLAGTAALAWMAYQSLGFFAGLIVAVFGLLVSAATLRL